MKNYKISIITVTKNSEKFLAQNISSVKSQNYKNHEDIGYELLKELQNEDLSNYYFDNLLSKKNEILDKTDF